LPNTPSHSTLQRSNKDKLYNFLLKFKSNLQVLAINKYSIPIYYGGGFGIPQRVICHGCNHILYEGNELRPPDEVTALSGGKCPKCDRKLSLLPIDVEVKPVNKR
jgi:hypothetical protein